MDWTIPLDGGRNLYVRPGYTWRSSVYFEDQNQPNLRQAGYGLLGLRVGMRFASHWDVSLWGDNLTNEKYLIDAGNTGLLFGIPTVIAGRDRSYGVTLRAKF
jgi:outer membrane receptor protein involved in Fe transport